MGTSKHFKGATPEGAVTTFSNGQCSNRVYFTSKEPHPKVRLQPNINASKALAQNFKGATPEGAVTTYKGTSTKHRSATSKEPHPKVRLQLMMWLQTKATSEKRYFKGATPEGAVTTKSHCLPARLPRLQRSHTRRCGYNDAPRGCLENYSTSKEPHPKVRLQLLRDRTRTTNRTSKEPHPKVRLQPMD